MGTDSDSDERRHDPAEVAPAEVAPAEVALAEVAPAEVAPAEVAPSVGDPAGGDPVDAFEARLAAVRARARASLPERAAALDAAFARHHAGEPSARDEVRRLAHQIRGIAEDERLRELAEAAELAAERDDPSLAQTVLALVARARRPAKDPAQDPTKDQEPAEGSVRAVARGPAPVGRSLRVLVVDDTEALRKLVRLTLERMGGHRVDEASSPAEAFEACTRATYDVVLLDAMMPGGSGVDACAELRPRLPAAKLVILSAATEHQLAPAGHTADAWWQKPLTPSALLARLSELVGEPG